MPQTPTSAVAPFTLARLDTYVYEAPAAVPVVTSFGRMDTRPSVLLRVADTDGGAGWGELWGNFPTVTAAYRARLAGWALPSQILGKTVTDPAAFTAGVLDNLKTLEVQCDEPGPIAGVVAALDQAIWDLAARRAGLPLRKLLRADAPDRVPAYASGISPKGAAEKVAEARAQGYRRFKLKIGFGAETDHANLEAIRRDMADGETLFTDANQRWTPEEAVAAIGDLAAYDLGWLEEPIRADLPAEVWQAVKAAMPMPLAAGENLRGARAFTDALEWVDYMQPDAGKLGGVSGCLAIARQALAAGRTYCPHWLAGGIGLLHSANLLAATGGAGVLEVDCNENPLRAAPIGGRLTLDDGDAVLPDGPGIGVDPDLEAIAQWRVSHETFG
ncbi:MAG: mandelate racemase/muconate lactonizing enzyme family protein [Rhodospirillaceae bacterium]